MAVDAAAEVQVYQRGRKKQPGTTPDTFNRPTDVAFSLDGRHVYVSDGKGNARVVGFSV